MILVSHSWLGAINRLPNIWGGALKNPPPPPVIVLSFVPPLDLKEKENLVTVIRLVFLFFSGGILPHQHEPGGDEEEDEAGGDGQGDLDGPGALLSPCWQVDGTSKALPWIAIRQTMLLVATIFIIFLFYKSVGVGIPVRQIRGMTQKPIFMSIFIIKRMVESNNFFIKKLELGWRQP